MTSYVIRRRRSDRRLLTVSKTAIVWIFGAACIALPLAVSVVGKLGGL
jgi:hypothetical protein